MRPADAVDLVDAAERAGGEDHRMPAGRADDDLVDAGRLRGDRAHHDAARVGRAAAGHVHRRAPDGHLAQPDDLPLRQRDVHVGRETGARDRADVLDRKLERGPHGRVQRRERRLELGGGDAQLAVHPVQAARVVRQRRVAAVAHGLDDRGDLRGDGRRGRHERADRAGDRAGGQRVVQPQPGASRHAAPRRSRRRCRP